MLFRSIITTPKSTAVTAKQKTIIKVAHGIITQLDIQFPPGPQSLLHLQINDALHQIFPYNPDGAFASDSVNISFREYIPVLNEPFELQAHTWNEDDTFEHSVIIRIGILPLQVAAPWLLSFGDKIKNILGG